MNPEFRRESSSAHQEVSPRIEKRAQKHIVIGTWALSRNEPNLFYWRDHNSYNNDPYLISEISSGTSIDDVARAEVVEALVFEGVSTRRAKGSIKSVHESGKIAFYFLDRGENGIKHRRRMIPMVFVEVMPSVLQELTKKGAHLLHPAWVLHPRSEWNGSEERSIEKAFKKFAAQKKQPRA